MHLYFILPSHLSPPLLLISQHFPIFRKKYNYYQEDTTKKINLHMIRVSRKNSRHASSSFWE